jgi:hypothetical protein
MRTLSVVPNGYEEVVRVYGNPDVDGDWNLDAGFVRDRLAVFEFPFPMRRAGGIHTLTDLEVWRLFWDHGQKVYEPHLLGKYTGVPAALVQPDILRDFATAWNPIDFKAWRDAHTWLHRFQAHKLVGDVIVDALREVFEELTEPVMREKCLDEWAGCFNFRANRNAVPPRLSTHSWAISCDQNPRLAPNGVKECHQPEVILSAFRKRGFIWAKGDWMHAQACVNF